MCLVILPSAFWVLAMLWPSLHDTSGCEGGGEGKGGKAVIDNADVVQNINPHFVSSN